MVSGECRAVPEGPPEPGAAQAASAPVQPRFRLVRSPALPGGPAGGEGCGSGGVVPEPGQRNRRGTRGVSSVAPPGSGRRCPRAWGAKFRGFEASSPGRPPCPCLKDRGDIFTPQTAAPLSPPAPIALI